jgi:hypothetical protein
MLVRILTVLLLLASAGAFAKCEPEKASLDRELASIRDCEDFNTIFTWGFAEMPIVGQISAMSLNHHHKKLVQQLAIAQDAYESCMARPEPESRRVQRENPERFKAYLKKRNAMVEALKRTPQGGKTYVGLPDDHPIAILDRTWYL